MTTIFPSSHGVLDAPPQAPQGGDASPPRAIAASDTASAVVPASPALQPKSGCPECGADVKRGAMFCSNDHKTAFHNRMTVRGRVLAPLAMAVRLTRGGTRRAADAGKWARGEAEQQMDRWSAEDRAAGRMAADDYIALRIKKGFDQR